MSVSHVMDDSGLVALTRYYERAAGLPEQKPYDAKGHAALEHSPVFAEDTIVGYDSQNRPIYAGQQQGRVSSHEDENAGRFGREPPFRGYAAGSR